MSTSIKVAHQLSFGWRASMLARNTGFPPREVNEVYTMVRDKQEQFFEGMAWLL
jgi:hypothetical protein